MTRKNFDCVNSKNFIPILNSCAPKVIHKFAGDHALGGTRTGTPILKLWFERLQRILPNLHLKILNIWVKGLPSDTTIIVRWKATATLADGSPYFNHGVHIITMKWGKVYELDVSEDPQAVAKALVKQAASGIGEALAQKIEN